MVQRAVDLPLGRPLFLDISVSYEFKDVI